MPSPSIWRERRAASNRIATALSRNRRHFQEAKTAGFTRTLGLGESLTPKWGQLPFSPGRVRGRIKGVREAIPQSRGAKVGSEVFLVNLRVLAS